MQLYCKIYSLNRIYNWLTYMLQTTDYIPTLHTQYVQSICDMMKTRHHHTYLEVGIVNIFEYQCRCPRLHKHRQIMIRMKYNVIQTFTTTSYWHSFMTLANNCCLVCVIVKDIVSQKMKIPMFDNRSHLTPLSSKSSRISA